MTPSPSERVCHPGLVYALRDGRGLTLDLYVPETPARRPIPVVVYFHGGGWVQGSSGSPSSVAFALEISAEGFAVACANYRLAPAHRAPAAIEDAREAVRWIKANASAHGLDPSRVVAMGNSAGGHLALAVALARPEDGFDPGARADAPDASVFACVDLCGIADVAAMIDRPDPALWAQVWTGRRDGPAQAALELARRCSPIRMVRPDAPPILLVHGDRDEDVPYEQSVRMERALREAGADAELATIEGAGHMLGVGGPVFAQRAVREARRRFFDRIGLAGASPGSDPAK